MVTPEDCQDAHYPICDARLESYPAAPICPPNAFKVRACVGSERRGEIRLFLLCLFPFGFGLSNCAPASVAGPHLPPPPPPPPNNNNTKQSCVDGSKVFLAPASGCAKSTPAPSRRT